MSYTPSSALIKRLLVRIGLDTTDDPTSLALEEVNNFKNYMHAKFLVPMEKLEEAAFNIHVLPEEIVSLLKEGQEDIIEAYSKVENFVDDTIVAVESPFEAVQAKVDAKADAAIALVTSTVSADIAKLDEVDPNFSVFIAPATPIVAPTAADSDITGTPLAEIPVEVAPIVIDDPVVLEAPVVTPDPIVNVPVVDTPPVVDAPVVADVPVVDTPVDVTPPVVADPVVTSDPVIDVPVAAEVPVETAPVETAPVETAPVETAPVETAPVEVVTPVVDTPTTPVVETPVVDTPVVTPDPVVADVPAPVVDTTTADPVVDPAPVAPTDGDAPAAA